MFRVIELLLIYGKKELKAGGVESNENDSCILYVYRQLRKSVAQGVIGLFPSQSRIGR